MKKWDKDFPAFTSQKRGAVRMRERERGEEVW